MILILLVALLAGYLFTVKISMPETMEFQTARPSQSTWESIFASPVDLELKTLHAGDILIDRNQLLQEGPEQWQDRYKSLPVLSHWISHPTQGEYLFDSAFSEQFTNKNTGNYGVLMSFISNISGIKNTLSTPLAGQLPAGNKSIKGVFLTHFHPDHSSGLDDLPINIPIIANLAEYDLFAGLANGGLFNRRPNWSHIDFSKAKSIPPFDSVIDIFGDSSVFAISTPGHTNGHTSYLLNGTQGAVLIVGDASHFSFGFKNNLAPAAQGKKNAELAVRSLQQLRVFKDEYPDVKYMLGHDLKRL